MTAPDLPAFAIRGPLFHTPRRGQLQALDDALVEVGNAGTILAVGPATPARMATLRAAGCLTELGEGEYLLPGLVDLHIHAPQWPQLGRALDVPLEQWLMRHTFPLEARYADIDFARAVYAELVDALLAQGTTTAVYFGTIHAAATLALAECCRAAGQRAVIGKVAMDDPGECPDWYRDADAADAIAGTRAVIAGIRALDPGPAPLVLPAIIPRFLPSCSEEALTGLGLLAETTGAHVQTHCSESPWEVAHGQARFGRTDSAVLDGFGLLRAHTILAHSNFTDAGDRKLIAARGAAIAHCPLSNAYFAGAILPAREVLDEGLRIGLGTDIAGGHSPSLLDSARFAVTASRMRVGAGTAIDAAEALWMATAGGGEALGLKIGLFAPGYQFDALVIDTAAPERLRFHGLDEPQDVFEKILRRASAAHIRRVWVAGKPVLARGL
jgi:guanine deaminase